MTGSATPDPSRRRWLLILVLAALVVVAAVIAGIVVFSQPTTVASPGPTRTATATPSPLPLDTRSPAASTSPTRSPTSTPTPDPTYGAVVGQEVAKGQPAAFDDGVAVRITSLESVDATATGPGDVAGPAVRFTLEVTNGSPTSFDTGGLQVNVYLSDGSPASALSTSTGSRLSGPLAPSASGSGRWEFSVPRDQQGSISIVVGRPGSSSVLVFS